MPFHSSTSSLAEAFPENSPARTLELLFALLAFAGRVIARCILDLLGTGSSRLLFRSTFCGLRTNRAEVFLTSNHNFHNSQGELSLQRTQQQQQQQAINAPLSPQCPGSRPPLAGSRQQAVPQVGPGRRCVLACAHKAISRAHLELKRLNDKQWRNRIPAGIYVCASTVCCMRRMRCMYSTVNVYAS